MSKTLNNGSFKTADGIAIASGTLLLTLSSDGNITAGGQISNRTYAIGLDGNGDVSGPPTIIGNDEITPSGTWYRAEVIDSNSNHVWGPMRWSLSTASPINLDLVTGTPLE